MAKLLFLFGVNVAEVRLSHAENDMKTTDVTNRLEEAEREWTESTLDPVLKKKAESAKQFTTTSLKPIERLYTPNDIATDDFERDVNFPGQFPYTRGIHPTGYRGKLWTMRQFSGFATPEETNRRLVDHVSDFNLVYTEHARRNLLAEGLHPRRIMLTGSPMREVLEHYRPEPLVRALLDAAAGRSRLL